MPDTDNFSKLVPGFDFLQSLVKNSGSALPNIGQWVAPTLDPAELEKRIEELRTVQFWLEQNARMLGATIQALEVQRMTLSTLKTMNVQMSDLRNSLSARPPAAPAPNEAPTSNAEPAPPTTATSGAAAPPAVDPMQWWGALSKQFTALAASAMKEGASGATAANRAAAVAAAAAPAPAQAAATKVSRPRPKAASKPAAGAPKRAVPDKT